jgi:hypothetical protein
MNPGRNRFRLGQMVEDCEPTSLPGYRQLSTRAVTSVRAAENKGANPLRIFSSVNEWNGRGNVRWTELNPFWRVLSQ